MRRFPFIALGFLVCLTGAAEAPAVSRTEELVCQTMHSGSGAPLLPLMGVAAERRVPSPDTRLSIVMRWPAFAHVSGLAETVDPVIASVHRNSRKLGFTSRLRRVTVEFSLPFSRPTARTERTGPDAVVIRLPLGLTPDRLRPALAHQMAHAILLMSRGDAPDWWHEATASWIAERSGMAPSSSWDAVQGLLGAGSPVTPEARGVALLAYLSERFGPFAAVRIWLHVTVRAERDPLAAVAELVEERRGGSLREELESFACWVLARGLARDAGALERVGDSLPTRVERRLEPEVPFSLEFVRLPAPATPAGLQVLFTGDMSEEWWVALVTLSALDGRPEERSSLAVSPMVLSRGVVPASEVGDVVVAVLKLADDTGREKSFVIEAGPVEPYPFVLDELELNPVPGGMHLSWTSQLETDVFAWRVLRSEADATAYVPVDGGTIPAAGSGTRYSFTDRQIVPGQVYSYVVEAVTRLGFSDRTQVVGARAIGR